MRGGLSAGEKFNSLLGAGRKTRRLSPKTPSRQPVRPRRPCGAHARSTGQPCCRPALANGRCANHGGLSTGARSSEGLERIAAAQRWRWARWRSSRDSVAPPPRDSG
ncbi:MAG: HGGxSTG domain-containing protein [Hyphomicrobiaceae bacterium]